MSFGGFGQSSAPKPAFGFGTPSAPSAFGQAQPQQQQQQGQAAGGGLFGAKPAGTGLFGQQQQPAAGTSMFGQQQQQQQQQQPAGGLFGSQQQQPQQGQQAGTSVFGQQQQQPQQQAGGGLFGAQQQQQPQAGGGLFGSTNTQQQPQAGGGLFSSTNNQQQQGQQQPAGGLFGSNNNQQQAQGQQQPQAGTSLFGARPAGTGLFGSTAAAPAAGTGGLFGSQSTQQPAGGSSLFGAQPPQQQQQQQGQAGGLFGQSQARPAGQSMFGAFGAGTAQPQQQQPQQGGLFGSVNQASQQPQQQQQGQFGGASTSNNALMASQVNPFGPKKELDLETRMRMVENAWNTNHPDCRFKYFFYNVVEEGTGSRYGRPAGATDDAKWAKALRDNPDPNNLVPVLATGWADVKKRQQQQENLASVHQERIKEILAALAHTRQTSLASSIRLANLQARQAQLVHRLIHLAAQTPQHIPLIQSTVFKQDEAEMLKQLEGVKAELEGNGRNAVRRAGATGAGDGRGRLLGQVNELWGQLEEIRRRRKVRGNEGKEAWVTDEKMLGEIAKVLATQQNALQKLSDLAQDELFDADVMRQALGLAASER